MSSLLPRPTWALFQDACHQGCLVTEDGDQPVLSCCWVDRAIAAGRSGAGGMSCASVSVLTCVQAALSMCDPQGPRAAAERQKAGLGSVGLGTQIGY